jgi:hypothetical protein
MSLLTLTGPPLFFRRYTVGKQRYKAFMGMGIACRGVADTSPYHQILC